MELRPANPMKLPDLWQQLTEQLLGPSTFTAPEVARAADVDLDLARRLWRALGFPPVSDDERFFTRSDVEILRAVRELADRLPTSPGVLIQLARVTGQSLGRLADAQVTAADRRDTIDESNPEPSSRDAVPAVVSVVPDLERLLGYVWRRHLLAAFLRLAAIPSASDRSLTVGFADLVGFTTISQAVDARALATIVDRFEAVAYEQVIHHGGRVVKMIGDEVLFVAEDRQVAADIAVGLVEAHSRDAILPDVRVGLAEGPVLAWAGDVLGPTVNLAHRLVNLARPGSVLVTDDLGQRLSGEGRFVLRRLRRARIEGIGRLRSWVLRRAHEADSK